LKLVAVDPGIPHGWLDQTSTGYCLNFVQNLTANRRKLHLRASCALHPPHPTSDRAWQTNERRGSPVCAAVSFSRIRLEQCLGAAGAYRRAPAKPRFYERGQTASSQVATQCPTVPRKGSAAAIAVFGPGSERLLDARGRRSQSAALQAGSFTHRRGRDCNMQSGISQVKLSENQAKEPFVSGPAAISGLSRWPPFPQRFPTLRG
jgi:hypothetical protein